MDRQDLFFEFGDKVLNHEDWEKAGKPNLWFKMYNKQGIQIYENRAYGAIMLRTPKGESRGKDIARVRDIVAFSVYYQDVVEIYTPYRPVEVLNPKK